MFLQCDFPGLHYSLMYPMHEFKTGRNLRMSPIYPKLKEAGAVFGQVMGYERPTWFQPTGKLLYIYTYMCLPLCPISVSTPLFSG